MLTTNDMTMKYRISCDNNDIDIEKVYTFISESYWAKGLPRQVFNKAINNSLCFSVLEESDGNVDVQVGFARMITDRATFAYLADVYIDESVRGQGLSKALMQSIMDHNELQGLRRIMLATKDAHGLYEQFGFVKLIDIDIFMQLWNPAVYEN